jgi:toxin ParE1/3/4
MADYRLSGKADEDLTEIYRFSLERFGRARANAYLLALEERFTFLAENPALGHNIDMIRKGYFRYEHVSHSIFYTRKNAGTIIIVRVLHNSMDAPRHM